MSKIAALKFIKLPLTFDFVGEVESEINQLALRLSQNFNEIQQNGIDLNGKKGLSMFSINSMTPNIQQNSGGFNTRTNKLYGRLFTDKSFVLGKRKPKHFDSGQPC